MKRIAILGCGLAILSFASDAAFAESLSKGLNRIKHQASVNASNASENVSDNYGRLAHQTQVNFSNLGDNISATSKRIEYQSAVNGKHLENRLERDWRNFIRWVEEDTCDRERRKKGEEAGRRCEQKVKSQSATTSGPGTAATQYYAAKEVECLKPDGSVWGSSTIGAWSPYSRAQARANVEEIIEGHRGRVCANRWHYSELRDGDSHWTTE